LIITEVKDKDPNRTFERLPDWAFLRARYPVCSAYSPFFTLALPPADDWEEEEELTRTRSLL
jgi:hypothetical protein